MKEQMLEVEDRDVQIAEEPQLSMPDVAREDVAQELGQDETPEVTKIDVPAALVTAASNNMQHLINQFNALQVTDATLASIFDKIGKENLQLIVDNDEKFRELYVQITKKD